MGTCSLSQFEGFEHDVGFGRDVNATLQKPGFVVAATGFRAEARIAERVPQVRAVAGGADGERLEQLIRRTIAEGGRGIISFGIATGLTPDRPPGTCLVGREVAHGSLRYPADPAWAAHLRSAISEAELTTLAGVDHPLRSPAEKHAFHVETGAAAADMESHIVARLAREQGVPFVALRVIADPATRCVPPAALAGIGEEGRVSRLGVVASLALAPSQLPAMIGIANDARRAFVALFRCHRFLSPGFGFFDLC
jgi:adenosylhomocysteine nucleosidase